MHQPDLQTRAEGCQLLSPVRLDSLNGTATDSNSHVRLTTVLGTQAILEAGLLSIDDRQHLLHLLVRASCHSPAILVPLGLESCPLAGLLGLLISLDVASRNAIGPLRGADSIPAVKTQGSGASGKNCINCIGGWKRRDRGGNDRIDDG